MPNNLILIPSRLSAKRLPNKPLLEIKKKPLIYHVYKKALKIQSKNVFVVTGDKKIFNKILGLGGKCILTKKRHNNGTERIYEGLKILNNKKFKYIINLQGDEPIINTKDIKKFVKELSRKNYQMGTMACNIDSKKDFSNKNLVKVLTKNKIDKRNSSYAINFIREYNFKSINNVYHHIGIYMYRANILKKFVKLKRTKNEKKFKLEQLRALENKIPIKVFYTNNKPIGVDTYRDFKKVKKLIENKNNLI